jgi:hypothetical protein
MEPPHLVRGPADRALQQLADALLQDRVRRQSNGVLVALASTLAFGHRLRRLATLTAGLPSSPLALIKLRQLLCQLFTRRRLDADSDRHPQVTEFEENGRAADEIRALWNCMKETLDG